MVSRPSLPTQGRVTRCSVRLFRVSEERVKAMKSRLSREERFLLELEEEFPSPESTEPRVVSRRELLRMSGKNAVVTAIGVGGLLELLANREAVAAGFIVGIVGVTREPSEEEETPHRHTFAARFLVTSVSPDAVSGKVYGQTYATISTGSEREDRHFHYIPLQMTSLEALVNTGPENNKAGEHVHPVGLG